MNEVLLTWPERHVRFICVSTGGRILGLGDIGASRCQRLQAAVALK
jgi:malate dehydrogenase (oxaloacetate-decarboxylating)(NADP+)